jgi:CBS domain-containing protein
MHDLPITRVMSTHPLTAAPGDTLNATVDRMNARRVHHVLVVEGGRLVGILSSADLLKLVLLMNPDDAGRGEPAALHLCVRDVMQSEVVSLPETATLRDAAQALTIGGFHAVPVVSAEGMPRGIVTCADLGALLLEQVEQSAPATSAPATASSAGVMGRLLEVLKTAEIYLHSGQSEQQHARLLRAVNQARELTGGAGPTLGL